METALALFPSLEIFKGTSQECIGSKKKHVFYPHFVDKGGEGSSKVDKGEGGGPLRILYVMSSPFIECGNGYLSRLLFCCVH